MSIEKLSAASVTYESLVSARARIFYYHKGAHQSVKNCAPLVLLLFIST